MGAVHAQDQRTAGRRRDLFPRDESGRRIDPQNFRLGPDGKWRSPTPNQYSKKRAAAGFGPTS